MVGVGVRVLLAGVHQEGEPQGAHPERPPPRGDALRLRAVRKEVRLRGEAAAACGARAFEDLASGEDQASCFHP